MTLSTEARTAGVTAALRALRGREPRVPHPGQAAGPERSGRLAALEADLLSVAWQVATVCSDRDTPPEVWFAQVVAMSQHWIDVHLCPALGVDLSAGHRLCDSPLYRALLAALVLLETTKPDSSHAIRSGLVGTAITAAREAQFSVAGGEGR